MAIPDNYPNRRKENFPYGFFQKTDIPPLTININSHEKKNYQRFNLCPGKGQIKSKR